MLDGGFTHVYGDPKEFIHKHGYNYFAYARNNLKADMFWDKDGRVVYHEHPPEGVHHHHVGHPEGQFSDHEHANGSDSEEGHEGEVRDGRERDPHYGPAHEAMHDAHRQTEQYGPFMPQGHPERRNREGGGVRTREEKIEMLRRLAAFGEHLQQKYNLRTPEDIQKNPDAVKELEAFMRNLHPEYGPRGGSHRERPPQEPYGPQRPDVPHTQGPHTTPVSYTHLTLPTK